MRTKRLPEIIMLTAGLITCVITILKKFEIIAALTTLLVVLLSFYVMGIFVRIAVDKIIDINNKEESLEELDINNGSGKEAEGEKTTQNE